MNEQGWPIAIDDTVWASIDKYYADRMKVIEDDASNEELEFELIERYVGETETLVALRLRIRQNRKINPYDRAIVLPVRVHGEQGTLHRLKETAAWRCYYIFDFDGKTGLCACVIHQHEDTKAKRTEIWRKVDNISPG